MDAEIECDRCEDTGKIGVCYCNATPYPPCSGCEGPLHEEDDWRVCPDCNGESAEKESTNLSAKIPCDCAAALLFTSGCQNKNHC